MSEYLREEMVLHIMDQLFPCWTGVTAHLGNVKRICFQGFADVKQKIFPIGNFNVMQPRNIQD